MPKSPSGPPGLWLADRMMPPKQACLRITALTAGVDSSPPRPTSTLPMPFAAAMHRMVCTAARLWKRPSPPTTRVWPRAVRKDVEQRLDEVLQIVRLLEHADFLAQAGGAGTLAGEGTGADGVDVHDEVFSEGEGCGSAGTAESIRMRRPRAVTDRVPVARGGGVRCRRAISTVAVKHAGPGAGGQDEATR